MASGLLDTGFESIKYVRDNIEGEAYRILAEIQNIVIELNTNEQLFKGIDSKGQKLKPKYSRVRYARAKNTVNPLPGYGTPDLKLTGDFYRDFYLKAEPERKFSLFSSDEKAPKLQEKYGEDIFGLTADNEHKINFEEVLPRLIEWMLSNMKI